MWRSVLRRLWKNTSGAVAPTIALSLVALIAAGGIAFDYARLAAMDTELQQAADQAALAAATQLDRADDARDPRGAGDPGRRPRQPARRELHALRQRRQRRRTVEIDAITFCKAFDDSVADTTTACTRPAIDDSNAGSSSSRPRSGPPITPSRRSSRRSPASSSATAVAGVQSSICNVAPLLVCVGDNSFPTDADIGKGMILKTAGGNAWAPGNYGYLDFGNGNQAVLNALLGNGLNGCQNADDNQTEPGNKNATDAINTRMDVYAGSNKNDASNCVPSTGVACPAQDTRKDMDMTMTYAIEQPAANPAPLPATVPQLRDAAATGNGNPIRRSHTRPHLPKTQTQSSSGAIPVTITALATVTGGAQNFGNGTWDRAGYMAANHPGITAADVATAIGGTATASNLTRYEVYQWEIANMGSGKLDPVQAGAMPPATVQNTGNGKEP